MLRPVLRHIISYLVVVFVLFLPLAACVYYSTRTMTKNELYLERAKESRAHAHKFRQTGAGRGSYVGVQHPAGRPDSYFPHPPAPGPQHSWIRIIGYGRLSAHARNSESESTYASAPSLSYRKQADSTGDPDRICQACTILTNPLTTPKLPARLSRRSKL